MTIGISLVIFGIFSIIFAQIATFIMAMYLGHVGDSLKCLFIPLYQWVYVKKEPKVKLIKWLTIVALISLIAGMFLTS